MITYCLQRDYFKLLLDLMLALLSCEEGLKFLVFKFRLTLITFLS